MEPFLQIENPRNLTYVHTTIMGTNPPINFNDTSREIGYISAFGSLLPAGAIKFWTYILDYKHFFI